MPGGGLTYTLADQTGPIRQGEIISHVDLYIVQLSDREGEPVTVRRESQPYSIVMTQDCDLAQDFNIRSTDNPAAAKLMHNILLCAVDTAENLKATVPVGSDIWKRIIQNKDDRYQYLREIAIDFDSVGVGIPTLLIDFKRAFTIPTAMLYEQLRRQARRRAVLTSPYLEHLSSRFAYFVSRVALPRDHHQ